MKRKKSVNKKELLKKNIVEMIYLTGGSKSIEGIFLKRREKRHRWKRGKKRKKTSNRGSWEIAE